MKTWRVDVDCADHIHTWVVKAARYAVTAEGWLCLDDDDDRQVATFAPGWLCCQVER